MLLVVACDPNITNSNCKQADAEQSVKNPQNVQNVYSSIENKATLF